MAKVSRKHISVSLIATCVLGGLLFYCLIYLERARDVNQPLNSENPELGGHTQLHMACEEGDVARTLWLLKHGANPNIRDKRGDTALRWLVNADFTEQRIDCMALLFKYGACPDMPNHFGSAPIHLAVFNPRKLKALIDAGANVNAQNRKGQTAMHELCGRVPHSGDLESLRLLINAKADINIKNRRDETPIDVARYNNRFDLVDEIIQVSAVPPPPPTPPSSNEPKDK